MEHMYLSIIIMNLFDILFFESIMQVRSGVFGSLENHMDKVFFKAECSCKMEYCSSVPFAAIWKRTDFL